MNTTPPRLSTIGQVFENCGRVHRPEAQEAGYEWDGDEFWLRIDLAALGFDHGEIVSRRAQRETHGYGYA